LLKIVGQGHFAGIVGLEVDKENFLLIFCLISAIIIKAWHLQVKTNTLLH
jgi:hypothetical protein